MTQNVLEYRYKVKQKHITEVAYMLLEKNINEIVDQTGLTREEAREIIADYFRNEVGEGEGLADWQLELLLAREV